MLGHQRVAIIGAGPAGCAAAFSLRDSGFETILYERGRPDKDKPCGDAFIPSAVDNLKLVGFDERDIVGLGGFRSPDTTWAWTMPLKSR